VEKLLGKEVLNDRLKVVRKSNMTNIEKTLDWLVNCEYAQLTQEDFKKIYQIERELENTQFDSTESKDWKTIGECLEISRRLLEDAEVYVVNFRVMKNRHGNYENGGEAYFWTFDEAENFIADFKKHNDGWSSDIDEPKLTAFTEADIEMEMVEDG